jgi:hypothetical protein
MLLTYLNRMKPGHAFLGTKILANARKQSAVSYDHTVKQMLLASEHIRELLEKAESADSTPLQEGLSIPDEINAGKIG